jgi:hypothetical protein
VQHRLRLRLGVVAPAVLPLLADRRCSAPARRRTGVGGSTVASSCSSAAGGLELVQLGERRHRLRQHGHAAHARDVLRQIADARPPSAAHRPAVRADLARQDARSVDLPAPFGPARPTREPSAHGPGDVVQHLLPGEGLGNAARLNIERASMPWAARPRQGACARLV